MTAFSERRVVVTGLGVVTSLGHDVHQVFDDLCRGVSGIRPIRRFDVSLCLSKVGGIIEDFDPHAIISDREGRRMLRGTDWVQTMGLCAADKAMADAALGHIDDPTRFGVFMGAGRGGAEATHVLGKAHLKELVAPVEEWTKTGADWRTLELERVLDQISARVTAEVNPVDFLQQCPCLVSSYIAMRHHAQGPTLTGVNLCSAGAQSIGEAAWVIRRDDADVMLTGGSDSMLNAIELTAFAKLDAVSRNNADGIRASRPFDLRRDGCIVGEGAAVMVLEERDHALRRGARIYAELIGYGSSADAYKVSAPPPDGDGAVRCMRQAIRQAGIQPEDVQHVNAHGTSTPLNDKTETRAIKTVFGDHARRLSITSTKSMTGHLIAAAGALEAVIVVQCLAEGRIPPTINLEVPDPACDLDYVPHHGRETPELTIAMTNSFAIGGSNATLVFRKETSA